MDVEQIRKDFPMLQKKMHGKPLIYLDSAATAQKPQSVIDAMSDFYANHYGTVHRAVYELAAHSTQKYQEIREKIRRFLNAEKVEEIIFTRGTTDSINLVASSFGKAFIQPGDEVIISEVEHHSNIVPWQLLCEDRGATLKIIPVNDRGELILEEYKKMLSDRTKIVAVAHIANSLGTVHPVKEIIQLAHASGAKVLIDGAQAAPHIPIDVQELDADFYAFSGHKAYGPTGIGVLYGKKELLEQMPPYQGGGDMIDQVDFEKSTYNELPMKFEAGTPMIAQVFGLGGAIDYLNDIGMTKIHEREQELLRYANEKLMEIEGLRMIGTAREKSGILCFVIDGVHPMDIGTLMDLQGIAIRTGHHCAQPTMKRFGITSTSRVSLALYNTKEEIDHFVEVLSTVLQTLC